MFYKRTPGSIPDPVNVTLSGLTDLVDVINDLEMGR